jgi:hypothetical protein
MSARRLTPVVWDVMVAAAFVVVSVTILASFAVKFLLTWLKKPHQIASQHGLLIHRTIAPRSDTKLKIAGHKLKARKNGYAVRDLNGRTI